jgi:hypothetical protein
MKRIVIAAVLGLMVMSSVAEACCGRRVGCGGGGLHLRRQKGCSACGGHKGFLHRCQQQTMACQQTVTCQQMVSYQTTISYQSPMVYSTPPVTYAAPQVPLKSTPQAVAQPPGKTTPQN